MNRLLVIEDETDSLEMLQLLLQSAGFEVVGVSTRAEAIRVLQQQAFDLVLADLMIDSREIAVAWTAVDELVALARPALVGLITGWPVPEEEAAAHHVAFVLQKPCSRDAMFRQLAAALQLPALTVAQAFAVNRYFEALELREYDQLSEIVTDDVVYQLPGTDARFSQEIRGRDAFLEFTNKTFNGFDRAHFEVNAIRSLPNGAMVEYVGHWKEANRERALPGAVMFELRDDRISRIAVRVNPDRLV
ncbi:MAG TPA: nuclear transport factor 2 family protein [Kofleriaceae bacterium]|nr:nuclear transport factor 2 family protein [Kofleriaceae bacterium]